ncbi:MAG: D-alanine--D-alanine ligase family protein [Dongiaceae bacterium]
MRVGLTYDLRDHYLAMGHRAEDVAEFDSVETIDAIDQALRELGFATDRVGSIQQLTQRLVAGERWDIVFNIAEGLRGVGREAQVPALLDAYGIPYVFSDPLAMALTLHKAMAKHVVRDQGVPTAAFAVVTSIDDLAQLALPYPLFAKPVAEGTGKGVSPASRVDSPVALRALCRQLLERHRQPVLVESFLPGREFTVGITGTGRSAEAAGVMEVVLGNGAEAGAYSYRNKEECESRVIYRLATDAEAKAAGAVALAAWRALGCADGGRVDLRSDGTGQPQFMEVNPLAGLHPTHSDLPILCTLAGIGYDKLIGRIMESALGRHGLVRGRAAAE